MNIYEQLVAIREDLAEQDASARTLRVMDTMIGRAVAERDSSLSVSRLQVLRHVMSTPDVLNDEDVRLDFLALQGDLEDAAAQRTESGPAYQEDSRPKLKKYYKKK